MISIRQASEKIKNLQAQTKDELIERVLLLESEQETTIKLLKMAHSRLAFYKNLRVKTDKLFPIQEENKSARRLTNSAKTK